jgi:RNA polymerase sigma-70 factor (ECF subfamily)
LSSPIEDQIEALVIESDPTEGMVRHQTSTAVWKAVLSLPEHYREVVVLCDLQGMSYADAAEAVHCAIGTVRSRLHRAHDMLGKKLQHSAAVSPAIPSVTARCMS